MKFKLTLRSHEFDTLFALMKAALSWLEGATDMDEKLLAALMARFYQRLHNKSLIRQSKYHFMIPAEEAMAFHIFWRKTPMPDRISSVLVNRIIGDVDKKFA